MRQEQSSGWPPLGPHVIPTHQQPGLYSINVMANQQGSGLTDDLMQATTGDRDMTLWVLAENARAQRFYDRHGFRLEGTARMHAVAGAPELRMVRRPGAAEHDMADR